LLEVIPLRVLPTYEERPARTSITIVPPAAVVMRPACAAAVQTDESFVYSPVPQTEPGDPAGGHRYIASVPGVQGSDVAFVPHVASGGTHIPPAHDSPAAHAKPHMPQCPVFTIVSTQIPEQRTSVPGQPPASRPASIAAASRPASLRPESGGPPSIGVHASGPASARMPASSPGRPQPGTVAHCAGSSPSQSSGVPSHATLIHVHPTRPQTAMPCPKHTPGVPEHDDVGRSHVHSASTQSASLAKVVQLRAMPTQRPALQPAVHSAALRPAHGAGVPTQAGPDASGPASIVRPASRPASPPMPLPWAQPPIPAAATAIEKAVRKRIEPQRNGSPCVATEPGWTNAPKRSTPRALRRCC
jgi:hypothetical protein